MKYVRMEDGIFNTYDMFINMLKEFKERDWDFTTIKVEQKYGEKTLSCGCKCFNSTIPYEITIQFIKQADTIEELCDEFVIYRPYVDSKYNKQFHVCDSSKESIIKAKPTLYKNDTIYGAIWTDKGLIYVAKMNDKGELELL